MVWDDVICCDKLVFRRDITSPSFSCRVKDVVTTFFLIDCMHSVVGVWFIATPGFYKAIQVHHMLERFCSLLLATWASRILQHHQANECPASLKRFKVWTMSWHTSLYEEIPERGANQSMSDDSAVLYDNCCLMLSPSLIIPFTGNFYTHVAQMSRKGSCIPSPRQASV